MKPYPLQWEKVKKENWDKKKYKKDLKKVRKVYETMNFHRINKTQYWGRHQASIQPEPESFCKFLQS